MPLFYEKLDFFSVLFIYLSIYNEIAQLQYFTADLFMDI